MDKTMVNDKPVQIYESHPPQVTKEEWGDIMRDAVVHIDWGDEDKAVIGKFSDYIKVKQ